MLLWKDLFHFFTSDLDHFFFSDGKLNSQRKTMNKLLPDAATEIVALGSYLTLEL